MKKTEKVHCERAPATELRRKAEQRLGETKVEPLEKLSENDVRALVHELQVHQIELKMQNEELRSAQAAVAEVSRKYTDLFDFAPTGYFVWDELGAIREVNLSGAALLGLDRSAAMNKRFGQFVVLEDRPKFAAFCQRALTADSKQTCEVKILKDGQPVDVLVEGIATQDRQGQGRLCRAAVVDIRQQKRADEMAVANQALTAEIAARKQAEASLAQAKTAAEAASQAKSQFLANMSHELRTPMNAILGMIDVALPKALDPVVKDCLETAKGSADILLTLLNDLLDSAKIESGKLELESAPFSLRRMLDQITRILAVRASERGLCFSCSMPEGAPDVVMGDRMRLQQVVLNLAGNAIKFTEHGEVGVRLRAVSQDDEVCLEFAVRDTGIGIPLSGQERLFQPFAQGDASMARRFGGTGLGLAICKSLVEMMGGRLWVESEVGQGSTFYFTVCLPLAKDLPIDFEAPVAIPAAARAPLRILLVEDNPANQKLATYVLRDRGHTVEIAADGQEAIDLTGRNRYDVVLMDVQMPGMNGLEATAAIRKREGGGRRVPIIAMTAHAFKGDAERCLTVGMDSKPIQFSKLVETVETIATKAAAPDADSRPAFVAEERAAEPVDAAEQVFCLDEALARVAGEENLFLEMVGFFFDEAPKRLAEMQAALERRDALTIARAAHRLKGTVIYLGARDSLQTLERLERAGENGDLPLTAGCIPELERNLAALAQALAPYRDAQRP
jgi:PAS domain S-box-containing protein